MTTKAKPFVASARARGSQAFTMIEVLLAIGIFGLVMIAIYASWSAILRGTRIGLANAAEVQRTRVAIRALEESVSAAVMYADNSKYYAFMSDTGGDFAYLSFVSRLPDSFPGSGLFRGQPVRRVTFFVDDQKNLKLTQHTLLDMSEQPYTITLAPNVSVFAMEFWNPRTGEWLPEWISTNTLPMMMRVAVNFGPQAQTKEGVTIRSIPLNAIAITRVGGNAQTGVPQQPGAVNAGGVGAGGVGQNPDRLRRGNDRANMNAVNNGGFGGMGGSDEMLQWSLRLPPTFGANRGTATRNPVFGP